MAFTRIAAVTAVAIATTCGIASAANFPDGRVYSFHSGAQGNCPGLDWHIIAQENALNGMIAWDNMKSVAHAVGTVNYQNRTFEMTANEEGGQKRTAKITGSIRPDGWLVADINGPNVNCKQVVVQWFVPPPSGGG